MVDGRSRDAGKRLRGCLTLLWRPREVYLALGVGLWLCGYFVADGWEQRRAFKWLVPVLLLNGDLLVRTVRECRWLWVVAGLLAWQAASRWWSEGSEPTGNAVDVVVVFLLLTSLVMIGRKEAAGVRVVGGLAIVASVVTVYSLCVFYGGAEQHFGTDRLKNVLIYREGSFPGLNSVLTGMLGGFGAVGAAWFARREEWGTGRVLWLAGLAVLGFGLMATQSRGAMLAGGAGLAVLVFFLRRAMWPAVVVTALTVTVSVALLRGSEGAAGMVERGSTGRLEIYRWFVERVTALEAVVGKGMATAVTISEDEFEWFVHHPHSSYLTQFLLTGVVGLAMMLLVVGWAGREALAEARRREALWLALLVSGSVAVLFDCAQVFSVYSAPRIEFLLVGVPAALAVGRRAAEE